jgi:hypothetical protein
VEKLVAPFGRGRGPDHFEPAGDGVGPLAGAQLVGPAESQSFDRRALRLRPDIDLGVAGAVGLAERVAAGDQRHGLLVVHRHAEESLADVARGGDGVRLAVRPFRVDVDEAHLHRAERVGEIAVAAIAVVGEPLDFGAPVGVVRLPDVGAAAGEAEGLEAHGFKSDVAGEDQQIRPRKLLAVFLLDRPQQPAGLVEIAVVRPGVERCETLLPGARAAPAVGDAIRAGRVPGHADEKRTVVAEIRRPPLLRVGHQRAQVFGDGVEIQRLELFGVIEIRPHGIGEVGILMKKAEVDLVGPPVAIARSGLAVGDGALARAGVGLVGHRVLLILLQLPTCLRRRSR